MIKIYVMAAIQSQADLNFTTSIYELQSLDMRVRSSI